MKRDKKSRQSFLANIFGPFIYRWPLVLSAGWRLGQILQRYHLRQRVYYGPFTVHQLRFSAMARCIALCRVQAMGVCQTMVCEKRTFPHDEWSFRHIFWFCLTPRSQRAIQTLPSVLLIGQVVSRRCGCWRGRIKASCEERAPSRHGHSSAGQPAVNQKWTWAVVARHVSFVVILSKGCIKSWDPSQRKSWHFDTPHVWFS